MPVNKFACPKCAFRVEAENKEVVLKHAKMHVDDKHPEDKMTEAKLREMIKQE